MRDIANGKRGGLDVDHVAHGQIVHFHLGYLRKIAIFHLEGNGNVGLGWPKRTAQIHRIPGAPGSGIARSTLIHNICVQHIRA